MLIVTAFLVAWAPALAADPASCRGVKLNKDPFTGTEQAEVSGTFGKAEQVPWTFSLDGRRAVLRIDLAEEGVRSEVIPAGYEVYLMMKDGTVLPVASERATEPVSAADRVVYTKWPVQFVLEKEVLTSLAAQPIIAARIATPVEVQTLEVFAVYAKWLGQHSSCFATRVADPAPVVTPEGLGGASGVN